MSRARLADKGEAQTVFAFYEEFAPGSSQELFDDADVWIVDDDGTDVVTVASLDLTTLPPEVLDQLDHIGLRIGTFEDGDFHLDLQGATLLAGVTRDLSLRVNEQAARMWLYGKDILGDSVLQWPKGVRVGDACIVVNARWEAIGIGESLGRSRGQRAVVRPIHDLGTYLRDQGES